MAKHNRDFQTARDMMVSFYRIAKKNKDQASMDVIAKIIDLYDSAFDELVMHQAELEIYSYVGAKYPGDYMGYPQDELNEMDD